MDPVVPTGEGKNIPLNMRVPEAIMKRLDKVAKDTQNSRTDVVLHLLRWALNTYDRERAAEKKARGEAA